MCDFDYITFWKRQNHRELKRSVTVQGVGESMNR